MCKNKIAKIYVKDYCKKVSIFFQCGSVGPSGRVVYCDDCMNKLGEKYPQGWDYIAGDICKHGVYIGDSYGRDFLCGRCEDE